MTETPPPHRDDASPEDPWFHPMRPEEHAELHGVPEPSPEPASPAPEPEPGPIPPPATPPRTRREAAYDVTGDTVAVGFVLALFAIAAVIVPTMTEVATPGDWRYIRSVDILLDEGRLTVFSDGSATAVGQILWGALFGAVFDMSPGMMRVSTLVMVASGAVALYAILRQVGVSRPRGALGMTVWLFNPLTVSLAFSFMTDAAFASAMLIATALYMRGLHPGREDWRWVAAGSVAAAFAFLIRQQGALVPLAVVVYLLASRRSGFGRDLRRLLAVVAVPAVTVVVWYAWRRWINDAPDDERDAFQAMRDAGWDGTWLLIRRIPVYIAFYAGLLLIPIFAGIAPWRRRSTRPVSGFMVYLGAGWIAFILTALYLAGHRDEQMPFVPQMVGLDGLGITDVLGGRPSIVPSGGWETTTLTIAAALGAVVLGLIAIRALSGHRGPERASFWLVVTIGVWQIVGVVAPSWQVVDHEVTLDRYLLPALPFAIVVALWALRDFDLMPVVSWGLIAVVAVFSVAAMRDSLVHHDRVWTMAEFANRNGVENTWLDAGSAWNGYHRPDETARDDGSWWTAVTMRPDGAGFIVATRPDVRAGYVVAASDKYDLWLDGDPGRVYLLRRWYLPFPVAAASVDHPESPAPAATPGASPVPTTPAATPALDDEDAAP